jgi:hypothetical protein
MVVMILEIKIMDFKMLNNKNHKQIKITVSVQLIQVKYHIKVLYINLNEIKVDKVKEVQIFIQIKNKLLIIITIVK